MIFHTLYFMSTVLQYKHDQTPAISLVEREAKNPDSTKNYCNGYGWINLDFPRQ